MNKLNDFSKSNEQSNDENETKVKMERTYAMIKPDAVLAGNVDLIMKRINDSGFKICSAREFRFTSDSVKSFYDEHKDKSWFSNLETFMLSGPCVGLVLEAPEAISKWRKLIGPTNVEKAKTDDPTCLRALYGSTENSSHNACHGSDSIESANKEILFFENLEK